MASVAGYSGPQFTGGVSPAGNPSDPSMYGSIPPSEDSFTYMNGQTTGKEKKKGSILGTVVTLAGLGGLGGLGFVLTRGHLNTKALKALGEQIKEGKLTEHLKFEHNPDKKGEIIFNKGIEIPKDYTRGITVYRSSFQNANSAQFEKILDKMKLSDALKKEHLHEHIRHHNLVKPANPEELKSTLNAMDAETFKNVYGVERSESKIKELVAEHADYHYGFNSNTKEYVDLLKECGVTDATEKGVEHARKHHFFNTDVEPYKKALKDAGLADAKITEKSIQHAFHHNIKKSDQTEFLKKLKEAGLQDSETERIKQAKIRHTHYHNVTTADRTAYLKALDKASPDADLRLGLEHRHIIFHNSDWAKCKTEIESLGKLKDGDLGKLETIHQNFYNSNGKSLEFEKSFEEVTDDKDKQYINDWVQTFRRKFETAT